MSDMQDIAGGCHCGAVRYTAKADLSNTIVCNCSHCLAKGFVLAFTGEEQFHLESGAETLGEYRFHKHQIAHRFCTVCGTQPFALGIRPDGVPMVALNLRCVDGIDLASLTPKLVDGRQF